jgi:hypothetical protein
MRLGGTGLAVQQTHFTGLIKCRDTAGWSARRSVAPVQTRDAKCLACSHLRRVQAHWVIFRGPKPLRGRGTLAYRGQGVFRQPTTVQQKKIRGACGALVKLILKPPLTCTRLTAKCKELKS